MKIFIKFFLVYICIVLNSCSTYEPETELTYTSKDSFFSQQCLDRVKNFELQNTSINSNYSYIDLESCESQYTEETVRLCNKCRGSGTFSCNNEDDFFCKIGYECSTISDDMFVNSKYKYFNRIQVSYNQPWGEVKSLNYKCFYTENGNIIRVEPQKLFK